MTIKVTMTSAGSNYTDSSPFDVYALSSVGDTPGTLIGDNVPKSQLVAGKEFPGVPIGTTYIKIMSALVPTCDNFIIVPVSEFTTTSTTSTTTTTAAPTTTTTTETPTTTTTTTAAPTTTTTTTEGFTDYYATQFDCNDNCTEIATGVMVAFPTSYTPTNGQFYLPLTLNGYSYQITGGGSPGPGLILDTVNYATCEAACIVQ